MLINNIMATPLPKQALNLVAAGPLPPDADTHIYMAPSYQNLTTASVISVCVLMTKACPAAQSNHNITMLHPPADAATRAYPAAIAAPTYMLSLERLETMPLSPTSFLWTNLFPRAISSLGSEPSIIPLIGTTPPFLKNQINRHQHWLILLSTTTTPSLLRLLAPPAPQHLKNMFGILCTYSIMQRVASPPSRRGLWANVTMNSGWKASEGPQGETLKRETRPAVSVLAASAYDNIDPTYKMTDNAASAFQSPRDTRDQQ
ncbi:hypothetical protein GALMADRAFT_141283 [Galerina marginata CBS 339.88]|uniref:Uncharacterized protein n=1 Tax=Galerina marginata (strain CBS 339.88) TaxID=685588 RepID=A0A067STH3_GALM3|nr:hypothetical protein GALMADRAFT_141283 [Galerina marginata CBS 339.88]